MNILFFDLETTGLDAEKNGITEVAAQLYCDGKLVDTFNQAISLEDHIANGKIIDLAALKVNNTTFYNQTQRCAELDIKVIDTQKKVLMNFSDWLVGASKKVNGKLYVAGHNVAFDLAFIKSALRENNIVGWDNAVSYRTIDTSNISRFLIDTGVIRLPDDVPKGSGLETLALALGIEVRGRKLHTALEDVKLCAEVYYAMKNKLRELADGKSQN